MNNLFDNGCKNNRPGIQPGATRYNRRSFLSKSFTGLTVLGLTGITPGILSASLQETGKIITRQLGKTPLRFPIVSNGGTRHPAIIRASYEAGMRYFVSAHRYEGGLNEKRLGDTVHDLGIRKNIHMCTLIPTGRSYQGKWTENVKEEFLQKFEISMKRLRTNYLDILFLYNVRTPGELEKTELLEALTLLKKQGRIGNTGFTTHTNHVELLNKAMELDFYDAITVSFNYTMADNKETLKALEKAAGKGLGLIAMKTQCGSIWGVDGYRKPKDEPKNQTAMLKWVLRHDFITTAIPSFQTFEHMEEDFSVAHGLEYTKEEKRFLDDENIRDQIAFCRQCRQCVPTCPKGVDVPALMRIHMYAYGYGDMDMVHLAIEENEGNRHLYKCRACSQCQAVCAHSVPVEKNIFSLKLLSGGEHV
jgi:predicted aldo/keto reductase-like oxidoreductase